MNNDWEKLREPFPAADVEWRIQRSGIKKGGEPWGMVLCYVTNRAIQERLDSVVGPERWKNEFTTGPGGGILCGISIKIDTGDDDEWVTKWDGAENTNIDAVKGGISGAMKRAAVQWGIGRYLYKLEAGWANFSANGKNKINIKKDKKDNFGENFKWSPPALPAWALPSSGKGKPPAIKTEAESMADGIKMIGAKLQQLQIHPEKLDAFIHAKVAGQCLDELTLKEIRGVYKSLSSGEVGRWLEDQAKGNGKGENNE